MYNERSEGLAYHRLLTWIENFEAYTDYLPKKEKYTFFRQSLVAFRLEQKKDDLTIYSTILERLARFYFFHNTDNGEELPTPRPDDEVRGMMKTWMETLANACIKYEVFPSSPKKLTTYFADNPPLPSYGNKDNIAYTLLTAYAAGKLTDCTEAPPEWSALKARIDSIHGLKTASREKFYRLGLYYLRQCETVRQHTALLQDSYGQDEPMPYILCQKGYLVNAGVLLSVKQLKLAETFFEYISDAPTNENPATAEKAGYKHGYPRFRVSFPQCDSEPQTEFHSERYDDGYCMDYENFYGICISGEKKKFFRKGNGKAVFAVDGLKIDSEKQISFADGWQLPNEYDCAEWIENRSNFFAREREQAICEAVRFVTLLKLLWDEWEKHGKEPFLWYPAKYLILPENILQEEKNFREKVEKALDNA